MLRGEGREREKERNIDQLPLACTLTGNRTCNPDLESNPRPFHSWDDAPTNRVTPARAAQPVLMVT